MTLKSHIMRTWCSLHSWDSNGKRSAFEDLQEKVLRDLFSKAKRTAFGKFYGFGDFIKLWKHGASFLEVYEHYASRVPLHIYDRMYREWWRRIRAGEQDVCWPGAVRHFAMTAATSEENSKYIPITNHILRSNARASIRQLSALIACDLPYSLYNASFFLLTSSTQLCRVDNALEGDISGMLAGRIPLFLQWHCKPGKKIARMSHWDQKLAEITRQAPEWDIGMIGGMPPWVQLVLEHIIAHYKLKNIHELWPRLSLFVHGGVSFDMHRPSFEKLLGRPMVYMDTYLASEGFIAYQAESSNSSLRMIADNGIFYEFVPFDSENFDTDGELKATARALPIHAVEEGKQYALVLNTNAGAWRYLIGDIVEFTSVSRAEIRLVGRTKFFLNLCGEHLCIENMNMAIEHVSKELGIGVREYTVIGCREASSLHHQWYLGVEGISTPDKEHFTALLDKRLKALNLDYMKRREEKVLMRPSLELLPISAFYAWMRKCNKMGEQHKFPRVLKGERAKDWERFLVAQAVR